MTKMEANWLIFGVTGIVLSFVIKFITINVIQIFYDNTPLLIAAYFIVILFISKKSILYIYYYCYHYLSIFSKKLSISSEESTVIKNYLQKNWEDNINLLASTTSSLVAAGDFYLYVSSMFDSFFSYLVTIIFAIIFFVVLLSFMKRISPIL